MYTVVRRWITNVLTVAVILSQPAMAHHSYAMFDKTRTVTVAGTVKVLQWTNPHAWLQVVVVADGKDVEYGFESAGPDGLKRAGWDRNIVKPGDKITVNYQPLRSGAPGGQLVSIKLADGRLLPVTPQQSQTAPDKVL